MQDQDLTQGRIGRKIWSIAWPMMLSFFFYTFYNIVDTYWVSKISPEAIAAVSISQIALFVMISLGFGVTVGSGVLMAMNIGAKNKPEAERVLGQSFVLSAILGAIFTCVSLFFADTLLLASGAAGAIFEPAKEYFMIVAGGSILLFIMFAIMFAFNAEGDTNTLTKFFAVSTLINIVLDPILIFGWGPIPAFGISGAAYATLVSQTVFMIIALRSLSSPRRNVRFHFHNLSFRWNSVKKVLDIGFPAALTQIIFPLGIAALTFLVSKHFLEAGAIAFSLGARIEFFAYIPAAGFGFGAMAMIGQNVGAKNKARVLESFKTATKLAFFSTLGMGLLILVLAQPLIKIFTTDPVVTQYSFSYIWIVALSYAFLSVLMIEANSFQAIGRSWPGFWIFLFRVGLVTIPLALWFTEVLDLAIGFVWLAVALGNILACVLGYVWIRKSLRSLNFDEVPVSSH